MPPMSPCALEQMAVLLQGVQASRALTNGEVAAQLTQIERSHRGRKIRPISIATWHKWKYGRATPRPGHRRVLAEWLGVMPEHLFFGQLRIDGYGVITVNGEG